MIQPQTIVRKHFKQTTQFLRSQHNYHRQTMSIRPTNWISQLVIHLVWDDCIHTQVDRTLIQVRHSRKLDRTLANHRSLSEMPNCWPKWVTSVFHRRHHRARARAVHWPVQRVQMCRSACHPYAKTIKVMATVAIRAATNHRILKITRSDSTHSKPDTKSYWKNKNNCKNSTPDCNKSVKLVRCRRRMIWRKPEANRICRRKWDWIWLSAVQWKTWTSM